ncbi:mechanosensitive ion channel family protein [Pelagicoccus mobilis]|uniref:Mechanosensitive ion channel n=1 Tax=Pelagicoccus mobilis TaxID=415221 RepID=A0A934RUY5_9BACT|nr:mechanosensitive ion channel domain-containing protein [Pelagicoccus mobilis]MBK1876883.1 mechanosensitive ion channel [Pelagicoccus mobilis]
MSALSSSVLLAEFSFSGFIEETIVPWWERFAQVFVGEDLVIQSSVIVGALVLSWIISAAMKPMCKRVTEAIEERDDWVEETVDWLADNLFRLLLAGTLWAASLWYDAYNLEQATVITPPSAVTSGEVAVGESGVELSQGTSVAPEKRVSVKNYILIRAFASIATLWLLSGALPTRLKKQAYYKILFFVLAAGLTLNLLGIWNAISEGLNGIKLLPVSGSTETRVTALTLVKGVVAILILIPVAGWLMKSSEKKVTRMANVSPALQVLSVKLIKVLVVTGAVLFSISAVGIDLSSFAVLGGAIGLGLGFGFQKVISNLISGVILLGDKSIKPGDVIEVDNTYGWINTLGARYTSVITRDGTEHLIPNEMMITEKVVNWSFSSDNVRVKIPFGVSYNSDVRQVMKIANEAGAAHPRVLKDPAAATRMIGFGDNSVDFELRVWLKDPADGLGNIRSDLLLALWDAFQEHNIEIPFPQRDLHIRDSQPIPVVVKEKDE